LQALFMVESALPTMSATTTMIVIMGVFIATSLCESEPQVHKSQSVSLGRTLLGPTGVPANASHPQTTGAR
jgi:hypothetical protein